ncbi:nascent polypeptide-associated complex subunit alpha, muscle-specific form-like isoform X2 [Dermacentor albipictus]|uniref:nascent polypeptide-associated complex subunit alpha, muscle-specific form-like isoform X2 n=1 Tax=Dermacentor albipictus TaxID=60249 RepID=UPI0038FC8C10
MQDLRFLRCILYFCTASNIFWVVLSVMAVSSGLDKEEDIFYIINGVGCALNLVSDVTMLHALRNPMKLEEDELRDMDEKSSRTIFFYELAVIDTVIFLIKGCILYALYQVYQNYDRLATYEEQNLAPQPGIFSNAPPVAYRFEPGSQSGVPVMPTGPALPASGYPKMTPGPAGVPSTRSAWSGMPRSSGQPHRVAVQQPHLPEQQQPAPSTQPQFISSSGIVHVPYCSATQPQLTVAQPAMGQGAIAEATATEAEDTECPPRKTATPEAPSSGPCTPNQANSKQAQAETKPATAAPSVDKVPHVAGSWPSPSAQAARTLSMINGNTRTQNIAKAASTGSVHVSGAASQETLPGDKPRRTSSRRSMATRSVPKFLIAKHGGRMCAEI